MAKLAVKIKKDPFPTRMTEFKDTKVGTNYTMVAYVSPDFLNWTVYRMDYNDIGMLSKPNKKLEHSDTVQLPFFSRRLQKTENYSPTYQRPCFSVQESFKEFDLSVRLALR